MDIMWVTELESIPGLAIFIDFKKAFDTVDWNFLLRVLEDFNFGPCIQKWIRLTMDPHLNFSNQKEMSVKGVRSQVCSMRGNFSFPLEMTTPSKE